MAAPLPNADAAAIVAETGEDVRQLAWLRSTAPDAAMGRYAAAMHFFMRGMLSAAALEHYRVIAKERTDVPHDNLQNRGP